MAWTLDGILNFAIPTGVILIFIGLLYWKLKKPIDIIGGWLKNIFLMAIDGLGDMISGKSVTEVTYK